MQKLSFNAPDSVLTALRRDKAPCNFTLYDTPQEFADDAQTTNHNRGRSDFYGPDSWETVYNKVRHGDLAAAEKSDKLLAKFESLEFMSHKRVWENDIAGSIPDVAAFIAGHPLSMRRKVRRENEAAPLAIIVDLASSGGIRDSSLERRGAAILALVRILSAQRPVELWAGVAGLHAKGNGQCAFLFRVNTTPLDLATAAPLLTNTGVPRRFGYALCEARNGFDGGWAFNEHTVAKEFMADYCRPAFPHVTDLMCIEAPYRHDPLIENPEAWLDARLAQYAPQEAA